jgi:hypothetical protein
MNNLHINDIVRIIRKNQNSFDHEKLGRIISYTVIIIEPEGEDNYQEVQVTEDEFERVDDNDVLLDDIEFDTN